jgi:predicted aldo/keto reductase-like oxidoreductase
MTPHAPSRRAFLQAGAAGLAAASVATSLRADEKNSGGIPVRQLGKTRENVSILGLGGYHSTVSSLSDRESHRLIQRAVDEGITFLDNAWDYHDGKGEERMGAALAEGGRRDKVFLMTKVCGRTKKDALSNLEDSLRRLQTDRIDLWQFHEICYDNDPDWIFADDGAIHAGLQAVQQGKVRFLGFTGHKDPSIHLKMLQRPFEWSTVQMPLNVMDAHFRSFQNAVLPVLQTREIAAIGMKSLGGNGSIVAKAGIPIEDALRYVLSLPISTLVSGIDSEKVLDQNLAIARGFKPLDDSERRSIEARTAKLAGDGRYELFKSSKVFDGTVHRKQHGFDATLPG